MGKRKCDICKDAPFHPDKKCCFNCDRSGTECEVWHTCGDDCPGWEGRKEPAPDYKELIERLRHTTCSGCMAGTMRKAADAIETLLAERDAVVEYIPHNCQTCKWWKERVKGVKCCMAPENSGVCYFGEGNVWQWRGPQKVYRMPEQ